MTVRSFETPKARVFQAPVEQFHAQHNQKDHGNGRRGGDGNNAKPKGGGQYADIQGSSNMAERALNVSPRALFSSSTRLQGVTRRVMEPQQVEQQGMTAEGHIVVQTGRGARTYLKPTGKLVQANRTRPGLVEFDQFEVDTVVKDGVIMGQPGKATGEKQYALAERFPDIPNYLL